MTELWSHVMMQTLMDKSIKNIKKFSIKLMQEIIIKVFAKAVTQHGLSDTFSVLVNYDNLCGHVRKLANKGTCYTSVAVNSSLS